MTAHKMQTNLPNQTRRLSRINKRLKKVTRTKMFAINERTMLLTCYTDVWKKIRMFYTESHEIHVHEIDPESYFLIQNS